MMTVTSTRKTAADGGVEIVVEDLGLGGGGEFAASSKWAWARKPSLGSGAKIFCQPAEKVTVTSQMSGTTVIQA